MSAQASQNSPAQPDSRQQLDAQSQQIRAQSMQTFAHSGLLPMQFFAQASHSFAHAMQASLQLCRSCFGICSHLLSLTNRHRTLRLRVRSKVKRFLQQYSDAGLQQRVDERPPVSFGTSSDRLEHARDLPPEENPQVFRFRGVCRKMEPSDEELMRRLADGVPSALDGLMSRYERPVLNVIYRFLGDADRAQEVAQDVFFTVYQQRHRYRPSARFSTWLFRIVKNRCLNERRRLWRTQPLDTDDGAAEYPDSQTPAPDAAAIRNETGRALDAALQSLPDKQRLAFVLSRTEGFSYRDVAEALDVSVAACESLIHRARLALRNKLSPLLKSAK